MPVASQAAAWRGCDHAEPASRVNTVVGADLEPSCISRGMVEFSSASGLRPQRSASRRQAVPLTHHALCWAPATDAHEAFSPEAITPQGAISPRWQRAAFGSVNQTWFTAPRQQLRRALRPPVAATSAAAQGTARQPTLSALSTSVSRWADGRLSRLSTVDCLAS